MQYIIKKIGYAKRPEGFVISEVAKNDCLFWEKESLVYFGDKVPKCLDEGDILIQEVSSCKPSQNHSIIGVYKCVSSVMRASIGPYTCDEEKGKWPWYIKVENLTPKFSMEVKNRLENKRPMLLDLDEEWGNLGEKRLPYYAAGWAYISSEKAEKIIDRIKAMEKTI